MSNVDGLVSGLDTTSLVRQLMQLERQPQVRLQTKKADAERAVTAYQDLNTRFSSLRDAARALATPANWQLTKATSSAADAVAVTSNGTAPTGALTFNVQKLAAAASRVSSGTVASTSVVVATGPLSIVKDGVTTNIAVGDGTLGSVVQAINSSTAGVKAAAVQVAPGSYRLQLTSTTTGAASAFTIGPEPMGALGTLNALVTAQDAELLVGGAAPGAYTVTSATNTVADILPGVTLTLRKADPALAVTVDVASDGEGLADKVKTLVDSANEALALTRTTSAAGAPGKVGGPLAADGTVRRLEQDILRSINGLGTSSASTAGITLSRQGTIGFDRTKFLAAYATDPAAVAAIFEEKGTATTTDLRVVAATARTQGGTYGVEITAAATKAAVTGTAPSGGVLANAETITISASGKSATYNALAGAAVTDVATGLNSAFASNGLGLVASVESGALVVRHSGYGTDASFTVSAASSAPDQSGLALGTYAGTNVTGQFRLSDNSVVAATGRGNVLSAGPEATPLYGLAIEVFGAPAGGSVTYQPGLARRLESVGVNAVDTGIGVLKLASDNRKKQVEDFTTAISSWDTRLARRESTIRKQFNAMEAALGRLRNQSGWLNSQIANLGE